MMNTQVMPEIGEWYTTHKSGVVGWVCEIVPNRTGSFRLRLRTEDLQVRWTTYVPQPARDYVCADSMKEGI
jgi:hypothetical protein